ncbi:winged helix DNA-binding domain-containing protein [Nocardioides insulae]|uniref:winged helix DNA-binding domain-containing protein n=1 Tax=Nocardioides insulae TaxID=394734 RepID=UPI000490BCE7|nr:winged helix DNA-binding domain-containing protein [Nocardioides insulae]
MRSVTDRERRDRFAVRHGLAPGSRYAEVSGAARAMTALHATEAATVHLALWARVEDVTLDDVERALYEERNLVKQLAMRRTLWALPRELLPAVWGSAAARTAAPERAKLVKYAGEAGIAEPDTWVGAAMDDVVALLADGRPRSAQEVRAAVPALETTFTMGAPGKRWGGTFPIGPRVLTTLGAEGRVVRAENAGHWRLNKPAWTTTEAWLGEVPPPMDPGPGYTELVRRWLWTFGPGTETDLVWWLGATKTIVRRALADVEAVEVALESGDTGWLLPDDPLLDGTAEPVEPWAALLPTLDPTAMGWKARSFYFPEQLVPLLMDTNGNVGTTAWWDGRIVGCWVQQDDGGVRVVLSRAVEPAGRKALDAEAARLSAWLDGVLITNVYASPQMRRARLP